MVDEPKDYMQKSKLGIKLILDNNPKYQLIKLKFDIVSSVLRSVADPIRDMVVRIQIWIRGSVPLTNGSGSRSCYF
jgi:hypothetical protein